MSTFQDYMLEMDDRRSEVARLSQNSFRKQGRQQERRRYGRLLASVGMALEEFGRQLQVRNTLEPQQGQRPAWVK